MYERCIGMKESKVRPFEPTFLFRTHFFDLSQVILQLGRRKLYRFSINKNNSFQLILCICRLNNILIIKWNANQEQSNFKLNIERLLQNLPLIYIKY